MGKYLLNDLQGFKNLLFYQLTSNFYYFDILLMKDEDIVPFSSSEITYFINEIPNKSLQCIDWLNDNKTQHITDA
jgi:hypothetical protein